MQILPTSVQFLPNLLTRSKISGFQNSERSQREIATSLASNDLRQKRSRRLVRTGVEYGEEASFDPLLALAEEIGELFRAKRLESFPLAACIKTEFKTIYAPEHIENLRTFTSVLTLTFRVVT